MENNDRIDIIKNQSGIEFDKLPKGRCVFVCSGGNWETSSHQTLKYQMQLLCLKGYSYFFIEWGECYGQEALQVLSEMKENDAFFIKIIATHVVGVRYGTKPDFAEMQRILSCDGIVYAYTMRDMIDCLVSQCSAIATESSIFYPSLSSDTG